MLKRSWQSKGKKLQLQQRPYTEWLQISMISIFIWKWPYFLLIRNFKNRFVPSQPYTSYFKRYFKYNRAQVWNCSSHDLCFPLRLRCAGQILVHFAKKSVISSVRQVPMVIFFLTIFCQALPIFKGAIIPPWGRINLCQVWNLTDFFQIMI